MLAFQPEDVAQHTFGVSVIAHLLCVIEETIFHNAVETTEVLTTALYHDASEAILTDVIAPVKKYNTKVQQAFRELEKLAIEQMHSLLPEPLQSRMAAALQPKDDKVLRIVHAADKLDALCKCKLEVRRGNQEFLLAGKQIEESLTNIREEMPSVGYFLDTFVPAFELSIDEFHYLK